MDLLFHHRQDKSNFLLAFVLHKLGWYELVITAKQAVEEINDAVNGEAEIPMEPIAPVTNRAPLTQPLQFYKALFMLLLHQYSFAQDQTWGNITQSAAQYDALFANHDESVYMDLCMQIEYFHVNPPQPAAED